MKAVRTTAMLLLAGLLAAGIAIGQPDLVFLKGITLCLDCMGLG